MPRHAYMLAIIHSSIRPDRPNKRLLVLLACGLCVQSAGAQQSISDIARAELQRRNASASEAQILLEQGDAAYNEAKYGEAAQAYRGAIDLLPANAPVVREQRLAALQRYSQASVEHARTLNRQGNVEEAREVIDAVLADDMAPDSLPAIQMREQLHDPIRTNPALTPEHAQNVEEVRLLLYKANGAYELGKFDEALAVYEDVLRVDPHNTAARRGMEKVATEQSSYYKAAYDQTRSDMLSMVSDAWEIDVPPSETLPSVRTSSGSGNTLAYADQLENSIVPVVMLEDVTIREAIDFFRQQSIALDVATPNREQRGINVVLDLGQPGSQQAEAIRSKSFSLNLRNISLAQLLKYICDATGTIPVKQRYAINIVPAGSESTDMIVRTYRVPPDFLTSGRSNTDGPEIDDPFADDSDDQGSLLARRLTAKEILQNRGVSFPDGASASFNAGNSTLRVRNTPGNLSIVDQIVETIANAEPAAVVVDVKVIRTQQKNLEELGFDWILGNFNTGGSLFAGGGTTGNGGDLSDLYGFSGSGDSNPMTAGNRSGDEVTVNDSIDSLILNRTRSDIPARAPGVFAVNGLFSAGHVGMLMRGLDQKTGVDLTAVPSVTTRSGQQATINITREVIYPTEYEPPEIPQSVGGNEFVDPITGDVSTDSAPSSFPVTPATPTDFEMREIGVILDVLPTVSSDKRYVDITLKPNITEFDGFINYGSPIFAPSLSGLSPAGFLIDEPRVITNNEILMPVFSKLGTETALTIADNATIVMGGLLEERTETVNDKTPVLGEIPVVGRLFQSNAEISTRTAIIFLVNVRVVDAAGRPFNP